MGILIRSIMEHMRTQQQKNSQTMTMSYLTLVPFLICFLISIKPIGTYGFSIKLIPIDRFDTMLFTNNPILEERHQRIYEISRAHVGQLKSWVSSDLMDQKESIEHNPNVLQPPVSRSIHNYYLTSLSVGTGLYAPYLVVDTGGVDTWMQCEECNPCFLIRQGNFNKSKSQSYRPLPCDDLLCEPRICKNNICMYNKTYFGSGCHDCHSRGEVGSDTFIFNHNGSSKRFPKTVFGCGLDNSNWSWVEGKQDNNIAGLFGLGLGKRSIFMQYANETKNRISYCLPSLYERGAYTYLHFGDNVEIGRCPGTMMIGLIPNVIQYAVKAINISINRKRLNIDPIVFQMRSDHTGGFILDSGSPHTILVQTAYNAIKEKITQYFLEHYTWHPLPSQPGYLDLCYAMPHRNFTSPSMTYHFEGASLFLPDKNVFQFFNASFCLMVVPTNNRGPNILGAFQQVNYRFLFDFTAFRVSFVPELCRFN